MKRNIKIFYLLFIAVIAISNAAAQGWKWQNPLPQGNTLTSVKFAGPATGYACTLGGTLVKTTNGGTDWTVISTGVTGRLMSVYAVDANIVYAVGYGGAIVKTINGGNDWIIQVSGTIYDLRSVFFTDANTGFAVGQKNNGGGLGVMLKTIDGGMNWVMQNPGIDCQIFSIFFPDALTGYAVGEDPGPNGSVVFKTTDGGTTWTMKTLGTYAFFEDICFTDVNTGYLVGQTGRIMKTLNGGATWSYQASGTTEWLNSVCFAGSSTGYAVGGSGTILKTTNGGTQWSPMVSGTSGMLLSVFFTDSNTGYAVGNLGLILETTNGGTTWINHESGPQPWLSSVCFTSALTGYAVGTDGAILTTTNGGTLWTTRNSTTSNTLLSVCFPDVSTGYAVGLNGTVVKTTDGGTTWTSINSGVSDLRSVFFTSPDTGYAGGAAKIIKTTNGGTSWTVTWSMPSTIFSTWFTDASKGFATSGAGFMYKTTNGGASWSQVVTTVNMDLYSICFVGHDTGYVAGNAGVIIKTTNGGLTWTTLSSGTTDRLISVHFTDANRGFVIGSGAIIDGSRFVLKTTNGGTSWTMQKLETNNQLSSVFYTDAQNGYIVGEGGAIIKTTCSVPAAPVNTTPAGNLSVCSGNSTTLTASGTGTLGWYSAPAGGIWLGGGSSYTTPVLTTSTTYYVQDSISCGISGSRTGVPVTVNASSSPSITGPVHMCVNSGCYNYSTETGMQNYLWNVSPGGVINSGSGTSQIQVAWPGSGAQTVSVAYGCYGALPAILQVTVDPLPGAAGVISGMATVCAGASRVSYSIVPVANAYTYVWILPPAVAPASGAGTNSITVDFGSTAASGNINVFGNNLCGNGIVSPAFAVTVNPVPAAPVVTLAGNVLNSNAPAGNQWYFEGARINGATAQTYAAIQNGYYWDVVTLNGCPSDTSNHMLILLSGTAACSSTGISVYPVPNNGRFFVSVTAVAKESFSVSAYNYLGVMVMKEEKIDLDGPVQTMIDLGAVPSGIYTLVIENSLTHLVKRILVNK